MRLPRMRFTVRWMMVMVATAGLLFGAVALLLRPYPLTLHGAGDGTIVVDWSDGSATSYARLDDAPQAYQQPLGPLVWAMWGNGSETLHLRTHQWTSKHNRFEAQIGAALCLISVLTMVFVRKAIPSIR